MINKQFSFEDKRWCRALLPLDATIRQVLENLALLEIQIVLIINKDETLVGTITDGDVRRALLRGLNLNSGIDSVVERNALVVPSQMSREIIIATMLANKIRQLPVVDEKRRVIGLHLWDEVATPLNRNNFMIIMAGGKGVRLRPHTDNCPKPMLAISGKPMLQHIIERAKLFGFRHFVIAIHYLGEMIEDYFGNGDRLNVKIEYLRENNPLGTAGALGLLNPRPNLPFIVTNGDVLSDINFGDLLDFHTRSNADATMAVRSQEYENPFGVVHTRGIEIVGFEEKPVTRTYINAGVYVLDPVVLKLLNSNERYDMPKLFELISSGGKRTVAYPMHEPWWDVGRPEDLVAVNLSYQSRAKAHKV